MWNYRSFAVKAEGKCGGGTTHSWHWRQSVSGEADLKIFGSQDWAKVQKRNCKSLEVQAAMKCGSGTSHLWKSWQNKCRKRNFRSLPVKTERKCGSRTSRIWQSRQSGSAEVQKCRSGISHFWQSMQNESADVELQIFGSQSRVDMRNRNIRSLAVKAEQKCGSGISDLKPSRQSGSAVKHFDSPVKLDVRKQILTALIGSYPTDCHCKCWRISLLTAILKDNVKTMCG